ncbi:MAG: TIGR02206 family membrane protein [Clostridia bacterium]|nr:TIGR02206 family membrane protein [Clostridia bacterium]
MGEVTTQVNFYKDGFFGYAEKGNFKYWSLAHFVPIILLALGIFLIYFFREKLKNWKHEETFRFVFAFVMLMVEMSYFWRLLYVGSSEPDRVVDLMDKLPLQVCEWTCIFACFMLMKKSKNLYQVCFFISLTLGIFPLLTPSVITTTGPSYYRYYQYWMEHILPILAVFYMTFVHDARPKLRGVGFASGFMSVLVTFALICNFNIPEANYLYLAIGTSDGGGSVMDIMVKIAPNIWFRLALLAVVVVGLFFLVYFISKGIEKLWAKRKKLN